MLRYAYGEAGGSLNVQRTPLAQRLARVRSAMSVKTDRPHVGAFLQSPLRVCLWLAGGVSVSLALSYPAAGQSAGTANLYIAAGMENVPSCKTFQRRFEPTIIRVENADARVLQAERDKLEAQVKARHNSFVWSARVRPNQCVAVARVYMEKKSHKCSFTTHTWEIRATPEEAQAAVQNRKYDSGFQRAEIIRTECGYNPDDGPATPPKSGDSSFGARG